jgi:hypothetical protein
MNKNPERPKDIDEILTGILNPKSKKKKILPEQEAYNKRQKDLLRSIFERYSEYIDIYRSIKKHKEVQMKELNSLFFIYHTYINKKEVKA